MSNNTVFSVAEDRKGLLWIGTENGGVSTFNIQSGQFANYGYSDIDNTGLSSSAINTVYTDKRGNVWIGTYNAGINFFNSNADRFAQFNLSVMLARGDGVEQNDEEALAWCHKAAQQNMPEAEMLLGWLPDARLYVIADAGHWPQWEKRDEYLRVHHDFLLTGEPGQAAP